MDYLQINNNTYGNPRYVIHFLNIGDTYEEALRKSRPFGGRKYHNKSYGGGIVFQTHDIEKLIKQLECLTTQQNIA